MSRICITGGPRTGKTTMAEHLFGAHSWPHDVPNCDGCGVLRHTDDLIEQCKHLGNKAWFEESRIASTWLDEPGPWIIEGVTVSRALRKWRDMHHGERPPVDRVIYLREPYEKLTPGQSTMAKGVRNVHDKIVSWLEQYGILTEYL